EAKLVRCTKGRVFDVAVDLRNRQWTGVELSAENRLGFYIPEGFAHGFVTLEPESELFYLISAPYAPEASRGVRWDDSSLGIDWPLMPALTISDRDRALPTIAATIDR
ncbi:MAG: dTDP-4-dehydrorhamnose 3,5-epimerase, partial [Fimbriimonadaceae bacterium]|nr:dTDP-4-dehydrorhamnose 3,5-epimerase [Fimbriimonadaceae bacterium]